MTLSSERALVLDGGTGAELVRRGHRSPQAWSGLAALEAPELLLEVHRDFLAAGAQVLTTNTFAATRFVLEAAGCTDVAGAQRRSVELAERACGETGERPLLAGSLSNFPPGFSVEAYPAVARECSDYLELAEVLAERCDVLLLEMIEEVPHAERLLRAASSTGRPLWVGISARRTAGRLHPYDFPEGDLTEVLDLVASSGPELVAVMHTPVTEVEPLLQQLEARVQAALGAYPELADERPADLVRRMEAWSTSRSLRLVGGCCGAGSSHVRALRRWVDAREVRAPQRPATS